MHVEPVNSIDNPVKKTRHLTARAKSDTLFQVTGRRDQYTFSLKKSKRIYLHIDMQEAWVVMQARHRTGEDIGVSRSLIQVRYAMRLQWPKGRTQ